MTHSELVQIHLSPGCGAEGCHSHLGGHGPHVEALHHVLQELLLLAEVCEADGARGVHEEHYVHTVVTGWGECSVVMLW